MTSILFAFQNLRLRCASWPVMQEKRSRACPALLLHAGRAAQWQLLMGQQAWSPSKQGLFCTSQNPWGNGGKARAELAPAPNLQWAREPKRGRARVVPWRRKSSRQAARGKGPEEPCQGAVLNATEEKKQAPGASLGAHPGSLESFLPPAAGHEGHLRGA